LLLALVWMSPDKVLAHHGDAETLKIEGRSQFSS
jgi:hypothetical protein